MANISPIDVEDLNMKPSVLDPCLFYKLSNGSLQGIQATPVDDTLGGGDDEFAALEKEKSKQFECKPRTNSLPFQFNGFWVDKHESGGYILHQKDYCPNLRQINSKRFKWATSEKLWIWSWKNCLCINLLTT